MGSHSTCCQLLDLSDIVNDDRFPGLRDLIVHTAAIDLHAQIIRARAGRETVVCQNMRCPIQVFHK